MASKSELQPDDMKKSGASHDIEVEKLKEIISRHSSEGMEQIRQGKPAGSKFSGRRPGKNFKTMTGGRRAPIVAGGGASANAGTMAAMEGAQAAEDAESALKQPTSLSDIDPDAVDASAGHNGAAVADAIDPASSGAGDGSGMMPAVAQSGSGGTDDPSQPPAPSQALAPPRAEDRSANQSPIMPPPPSAEDRSAIQPPAPGSVITGGGVYDKENDKNNPAARTAAQKEAEAGKKDGQDSAASDKEKSISPLKQAQADNAKKKEERNNKQRRGYFKSTRSRISLAVGAIGAAASIVAAVAFLPTWALNQMHAKIQDALMDRVNYALEATAEKIIGKYLKEQILPSLDACGGNRINNTCYVDPGGGPLSDLYAKWKKARVDRKLMDRYGVELRRAGDEIEIFRHGKSQGVFGLRTAGSRGVINDVLDVTEGYGVRDRWTLRHAINSQYGGKWCLFLCEERDNLSDRFSPIRRLKLKIAARIAAKVDGRMGALMVCAITNCTPEALDDAASKSAKRALASVDKELLEAAAKELEGKTFSQAAVKQVFERLAAREVIGKVIERLGIQVAVETGVKAVPVIGWIITALDVGAALDYINIAIDNRTMSEFIYKRNVSAYIEFASGMTVCKDETQNLLPIAVGTEVRRTSLFEKAACFQYVQGFASSRFYQASLGISPKSTITCKLPTYLTVQLDKDSFSLGDLIFPLAGFLDVVRKPDTSKESVVLRGEEDPFVCPDKYTRTVIDLENFLNDPYVSKMRELGNFMGLCAPFALSGPLGPLLQKGASFLGDLFGTDAPDCGPESLLRTSNVWRKVKDLIGFIGGEISGFAMEVITGIVTNIPGFGDDIIDAGGAVKGAYDSVTDEISQKAMEAFNGLLTTIFPLPVNPNPDSGSEVLDQHAGGIQGMASTFAMGVPDEDNPEEIVGLQAGAPTLEQLGKLDVAIQQNKRFDLENKPLLARYFDLSDHSSLASVTLLNMASALPLNGQPLGFNVDPFAAVSNIGSLLGFSARASAQAGPVSGLPTDRSRIWGIPDYAFTVEELDAMDIDEALSPEFASAARVEREESLDTEATVQDEYGNTYPAQVYRRSNLNGLASNTEMVLKKFADPDTDEEYQAYWSQLIEDDLQAPIGSGGGTPATPGQDDTGPCAPGTTEYRFNGQEFYTTHDTNAQIRLCTVKPGMHVAASISGNALALVNAAAGAGFNLGGGAFRSYQSQIDTRIANCGGNTPYNVYQKPPGQCSPPTARPGQSMHELGQAIDFTNSGQLIRSRSIPVWLWLNGNAGRYGLQNLPSEPWHWSTNGK